MKKLVHIFKNLVNIYMKHNEVLLYIYFGGLTTLVNYIAYYICTRCFAISIVASNMISWLLAVIFAYITNKVWVFESKTNNTKKIVHEIILFFSARITSGILDTILLVILCDIMQINDIFVKILNGVVIVSLNYFFSKMIIFNKDR